MKGKLGLFFTLLLLSACAPAATARPGATVPSGPTAAFTPVAAPSAAGTAPILPTNTPSAPPTARATQPPTPRPSPTPRPTPAPGVMARGQVEGLEDIGQRGAGSPDEARAADYVANVFARTGYTPQRQPFTFTTRSDNTPRDSANVVAVKPGQSPQTILVGAHYDSVAVGRGVDDNASGVAVMLEVAERLAAVETPYTVVFIAFGAEEVGWKGSRHYVEQMSAQERQDAVLMVNLDSLIAGDMAYVYGDLGAGGQARDWCLQWAQQQGVDLRTQTGQNPEYPAGTTGPWSDHVPFEQAGIPYVYFESTNWTLGEKDGFTQVDESLGESGEIWHTPYDNLAYLEETFPGRADERLWLFVEVLQALLCEFRF